MSRGEGKATGKIINSGLTLPGFPRRSQYRLRSLFLLTWTIAVASAGFHYFGAITILLVAIVATAIVSARYFVPVSDPRELEFHRILSRRPQLNDVEFYDTFYAGTAVPREIPTRLRMALEDATGYDF